MTTLGDGYEFRGKTPPSTPRKRISAGADITGQRFGRLVAQCDFGIASKTQRWWGCECDCGAKLVVRSCELKRGHTRSCGCLSAEIRSRSPGRNRLPYGEASFGVLYGQYERSARSRGYKFELTRPQFRELVTSNCAYCGEPPSRQFSGGPKTNGTFLCNGVDRSDNTRGYVAKNCKPCCTTCNMAKGRMRNVEWHAWLTRIAIARVPKIVDRDGRPLFAFIPETDPERFAA